MNAKLAAGALGALIVVGLAALFLLGEDPPPPELDAPPPRPSASVAPRATPTPVPFTPAPRQPEDPPAPRPAQPATPAGELSTLRGEALLRHVRALVERGEGAADDRAAARAAGELQALLQTLAGRGEAAEPDATACLDRAEARGVQEIGVRLLARLGGPQVTERLADLSLAPERAPEVRLLALRLLQQRDGAFAQGAIADVVQDLEQPLGLRCFAMDQLVRESASILEDLCLDREDDPAARAYALETLYRLELARARAAHAAMAEDPTLAEVLGGIERR